VFKCRKGCDTKTGFLKQPQHFPSSCLLPCHDDHHHTATSHISHLKIKCSASVAVAQMLRWQPQSKIIFSSSMPMLLSRYSMLTLSTAAGCCTHAVTAASTTEQRQRQWQKWQSGGSFQAAAAASVEAAAIINNPLLILGLIPAHSADSGKLRTSSWPHFFLMMIVFPKQPAECFVFRGIPADSGCQPWEECIS